MMLDLHTHSTASDGTDSPLALVEAAHRAGVRVLAITDHDTFDGWRQARAAAADTGIDLIAGVELSTSLEGNGPAFPGREALPGFRGDVHLLAYFPVEGPPPAFQHWVASLLESRWERNRALLARLAGEGIEISEKSLRARGGGSAGRVHIARMLLEEGYVGTVDEAFRRLLGERAPSFVARRSPPIEVALEAIGAAGGVASLAHPVRFWSERWEAAERFCGWLKEAGLAALEVWHSEQSAAYSAHLAGLAEKYALGRTGGSDYHGRNKPEIRLGIGRGQQALVPAAEMCWRPKA